MIDTITFAWRSAITDPPPSMERLEQSMSPSPQYGIRVGDGAIFVRWEQATQVVHVRLSVPRWVNRQKANWPLASLSRGVEDLRLDALDGEIRRALCLPRRERGTAVLPIPSFPVTKVAYTLDVRVPDAVAVLEACSQLRPTRRLTYQSWGQPVETVQWGGKRRIQIYNKAAELRKRHKMHDLAEAAAGIVRLEVTLNSIEVVRRVFFAAGDEAWGYLPTVAYALNPAAGRRVMHRQLDRLGLLGLCRAETRDDATATGATRQAVGAILKARELLSEDPTARVGRRASLTQDRAKDLLVTAQLIAAGFSPREINKLVGNAPGTTSEAISDLRSIGVDLGGSRIGYSSGLAQLLANIPDDIYDPPRVEMPEGTLAALSPYTDEAEVERRERARATRAGTESIRAAREQGHATPGTATHLEDDIGFEVDDHLGDVVGSQDDDLDLVDIEGSLSDLDAAQ